MDKCRRPIRWYKLKVVRFVKQSELHLSVWTCSPAVVTEVTGNYLIRGAGICSTQGYLNQCGVKGNKHGIFWVHMVTYIFIYIKLFVGIVNFHCEGVRLCGDGLVPYSVCVLLNSTTQHDALQYRYKCWNWHTVLVISIGADTIYVLYLIK
jgi:hypothetical protein